MDRHDGLARCSGSTQYAVVTSFGTIGVAFAIVTRMMGLVLSDQRGVAWSIIEHSVQLADAFHSSADQFEPKKGDFRIVYSSESSHYFLWQARINYLAFLKTKPKGGAHTRLYTRLAWPSPTRRKCAATCWERT